MNLRLLIAAAALAASAGVQAQTVQVQTGTSPVLEVQRLAPQLLAFAGGDVNFANLVNGLALGLPVTLTTPVGIGVTQVVNFTPLGTMSALQIAQTLETARQSLISRGIATPTAQQIGATLIGGQLPTALGTVQVTGAAHTGRRHLTRIQLGELNRIAAINNVDLRVNREDAVHQYGHEPCIAGLTLVRAKQLYSHIMLLVSSRQWPKKKIPSI